VVERSVLWRDAHLSGVELLRARFVRHAFLPHAHETYALGVIEAGAEGFAYRGERVVAPAGSVVVLNPGEVHTGHAAGAAGWQYRMLYPEVRWLHETTSELGGRGLPYFPFGVVHDTELARLVRAAHVAFEAKLTPLERESRLRVALAHLVARHADVRHERAVRNDPEVVARTREILEASVAVNVTLEEVARRVGVSPFHLARRFREVVGMPPHAYQLMLRAREARKRLTAGCSVPDVAFALGFADQAHLTRTFKRVYGVPPGRFVQGLRGS